MKFNIERLASSKKHVVRIQSSIWLPIWVLLIVFTLATVLILNGISVLSKKSEKLVPQASHVSYWCASKRTAYPRTAQVYPPIKSISQVNEVERDLERDTKCSIVSIYAWQNVDCLNCVDEQEIRKLTKALVTIDGENRALKRQVGKGSRQ